MTEDHTRDHLANERTFLAWVRTSIALMGFGVVIAKLRFLMLDINHNDAAAPTLPPAGTHSTWLGLAFAGVGLLTLLFAAFHYEQSRRAIDTSSYRAPRHGLYAFVAVIFLLGLASVLYLVALVPHS